MSKDPAYSDLWLKSRAKIQLVFGQAETVTVPKWLVRWTGDYPSAILLNQILYYTSRKEDGWFYKSYKEWEAELMLTETQVRRSVKAIKKLDLGLETKLKKAHGAPTLHYRIDPVQFEAAHDRFISEYTDTVGQNGFLGNVRIDPDETAETTVRSDPNETSDSLTSENSSSKDLSPPARAGGAEGAADLQGGSGNGTDPSSLSDDSPDEADPSEAEEAIEVPKRRNGRASPKPPSETDKWKALIGWYSFDTPVGEPLGPVEGRIKTILGGISKARFHPKLTLADLANAYEWWRAEHGPELSFPSGSGTVVTMIRGWIRADRPALKYYMAEYGLENLAGPPREPDLPPEPPPPIPEPTVDFEGFPLDMDPEEKARRRADIQRRTIKR